MGPAGASHLLHPPQKTKGPQQGPRQVLGRRSGHGTSCSLGSTDIFCQTEGKQQPRLGEISSPRARQGTLLPGLARAAANWKIIQKISTPTLGFDFSMHDVPSKKSGEGWKVFPITFPQNTCRTIYGKAPGEHGRTPRTRPSRAPRRCHSLLPTTTSLHPCSAAQPGLLCLEKIHPKQKKKTLRSLNGTSSLHPEAIPEAHGDPNKSPGC